MHARKEEMSLGTRLVECVVRLQIVMQTHMYFNPPIHPSEIVPLGMHSSITDMSLTFCSHRSQAESMLDTLCRNDQPVLLINWCVCQSQHKHISRWFVCWLSLGMHYETISRWHTDSIVVRVTQWRDYTAVYQLWWNTDNSTKSIRVELPELLKQVSWGIICISKTLKKKKQN